MIDERSFFAAIPIFLLLSAQNAWADAPQAPEPGSRAAAQGSPLPPPAEPSLNLAPEHHFGWAATDAKRVQLGVNFGLLQLALGGYQTYSIGPVLGYKVFVWKGLYANGYARYWPNVASTLTRNEIALEGSTGTVTHHAHDFGIFANVSIGYAFDL